MVKKEVLNFYQTPEEKLQVVHNGVEWREIEKELTEKQVDIIREVTEYKLGFDPFSNERIKKTKIWLNTPSFHLGSERKELRNSEDWKWN